MRWGLRRHREKISKEAIGRTDVFSWTVLSVIALLAAELVHFWFATTEYSEGSIGKIAAWTNTTSAIILVILYLLIVGYLYYNSRAQEHFGLPEKGIVGAASILALLMERAIQLELYAAFIGVFGTTLASAIVALAVARYRETRES